MTILKSQVNPRSAEFRANAERMSALVQDLKEKVAIVRQGGDAAAREKHLARGKLLPRERVMNLMFDLNREQGTTLLLVTHDRAIAERCERRITIEAGCIAQQERAAAPG